MNQIKDFKITKIAKKYKAVYGVYLKTNFSRVYSPAPFSVNCFHGGVF